MALVFVGSALSWVTRMQSLYGTQSADIANAFNGIEEGTGVGGYGTLGYYWHWPAKADSNRGLGGGIAWAWDDNLCKDTLRDSGVAPLEDQFLEDFFFVNFIVCQDIKASMHRAFQTWADMHQHIKFVDVTEECRRLYGEVKSNCSLVELFVTVRSNDGYESEDKPYPHGGAPYPNGDPKAVWDIADSPPPPAARRLSTTPDYDAAPPGNTISSDVASSGTAAASAIQYGQWSLDLRTTNGHVQCTYNEAGECVPRHVIEVYGGIIYFNTDQCWYLDSKFCAPLHAIKSSMGAAAALSLFQGLAYTCMALALVVTIYAIWRVLRHQHCGTLWKSDRDGHVLSMGEKMENSAKEMSSWGVLPVTAVLLGLWVPISLQHNIFTPCWECYDFEGAAVHEIGHVLGLSHPDTMGTVEGYPVGNNSYSTVLAANSGMLAYDDPTILGDACTNPWSNVKAGVWPGADDVGEETGVRATIMETFTTHNPKVCLTPDDIEGLNILYPVCTGRAMVYDNEEAWNCHKPYQRIGWVRVLIWIFIPIVLILFCQMLVLSCLKRHDERLHKAKDAKLDETLAVAKQASRDKSRAEAEAQRLNTTLQEQQATEDSRVEAKVREKAAASIAHKFGATLKKKPAPEAVPAPQKKASKFSKFSRRGSASPKATSATSEPELVSA